MKSIDNLSHRDSDIIIRIGPSTWFSQRFPDDVADLDDSYSYFNSDRTPSLCNCQYCGVTNVIYAVWNHKEAYFLWTW